MSRFYTVPYSGTLTNSGGDADLLELLPADDKPTRLRGWLVGQTSEVGDATAEGLRLSVIRLPATVTSGNGTAVTPATVDSADTAAGVAAESNGATVATTNGTAVTLLEVGWTIQASPWEFWYPDERFCPIVKQGEGLVVRCQTTAADDISIAITFFVEEL